MAQVTVAPMHIIISKCYKKGVSCDWHKPHAILQLSVWSSFVSIHKHVYGLRLACLYDSLKPSDEDTKEKIKYQWSLDKKALLSVS